MAANEDQIGGQHYKTPVEHWDWAQYLPYLEGVATKYIGRHMKKGKEQDLRKAMHFIEKIYERDYPEIKLEWSVSKVAQEGEATAEYVDQ